MYLPKRLSMWYISLLTNKHTELCVLFSFNSLVAFVIGFFSIHFLTEKKILILINAISFNDRTSPRGALRL